MHLKTVLVVIVVSAVLAALIFVGFLKISADIKGSAGLNMARALEKEEKFDEAIKECYNIITENPQTKKAGEAYIYLGGLYEKKNRLVEARDTYKKALETYPDPEIVNKAKGKLENLNIKILFSPLIDSYSRTYEVQSGDSLAKIAKVFATTVDLLKKSNNLENDYLRQGTSIKIVTAKFSIVVDKSQNLLFLKENGEIIKTYKVATGANNSTPIGTFKIVEKLVDPVWYSAGAVIPAGSPKNILGTRWLGISKAGYGIHGTTDPGSLGTQVTAGCVRMLNADVEELYTIVPTGTEVEIIE